MKSVLISIQPRWCELIASGKKTIEIRKSKPKLETPFKVYIYMTAGDAVYPVSINGAPYTCSNVGGKVVIGEFVCENIECLNERDLFEGMDEISNSRIEEYSCLSIDELLQYKGNKDEIYAWHITGLVIYDKPKELREFYTLCEKIPSEIACRGCINNQNEFCQIKHKPLTRPPQSWCYVEELGV